MKAQKKLAAATLTRRIDQWAQELYDGSSVMDPGSKAQGLSLGEFIEDVRHAEFTAQVRNVAGQTHVEADKTDGSVKVVDDEGEELPEAIPVSDEPDEDD